MSIVPIDRAKMTEALTRLVNTSHTKASGERVDQVTLHADREAVGLLCDALEDVVSAAHQSMALAFKDVVEKAVENVGDRRVRAILHGELKPLLERLDAEPELRIGDYAHVFKGEKVPPENADASAGDRPG